MATTGIAAGHQAQPEGLTQRQLETVNNHHQADTVHDPLSDAQRPRIANSQLRSMSSSSSNSSIRLDNANTHVSTAEITSEKLNGFKNGLPIYENKAGKKGVGFVPLQCDTDRLRQSPFVKGFHGYISRLMIWELPASAVKLLIMGARNSGRILRNMLAPYNKGYDDQGTLPAPHMGAPINGNSTNKAIFPQNISVSSERINEKQFHNQ